MVVPCAADRHASGVRPTWGALMVLPYVDYGHSSSAMFGKMTPRQRLDTLGQSNLSFCTQAKV